MLSTHYRAPHRPGERDLNVIDLLARQATDWIERTHTEAELRESQVQMQAILNTATDAIITIDAGGITQSVNPATERMFGYTPAELLGQNVKLLMPPPYGAEHDGYLARYRQTGEKHIIGIGREVQGQRKDGSTFPVDLAVSEYQDRNQLMFSGVLRDLSGRKALEREVLQAAALEQQRIGQELHDTSGQELTALGLLADSLVNALEDKSAAEANISIKMAEGIKRVLGQIRAFSRGLIGVEVDAEGLMAALAELAARTTQLHGVNCTFECKEPVRLANNQAATQLYGIAREAVTNALRHAQARNIKISLESAGQTIRLHVQDDGIGLPEPTVDVKGMGLKIMRYRAGLINGHLSIRTAVPAGAAVSCTLRKDENNAEGQNQV
jgi:PAS domain S-box-containing protein